MGFTRSDKKFVVPLLAIIFTISVYLTPISCGGCKEAVCASIVSKCMLTQSCKCDAKNVTCSKDCFYCLDFLYSDCCSCVEMCPTTNETDSDLSTKSHVEDLPEPFPDLFIVLTEEKDSLLRWTSHTFPVELSFIDKEIKIIAKNGDADPSAVETTNCTVAYMSQCMPWNKCKESCCSMGATSYRWFHDGCCECVGSNCINYGVNESKCLDCPPNKNDMTPEELNLVSKDMMKKDTDEEYSEDTSKGEPEEFLSKKEEVFDDMQDISN